MDMLIKLYAPFVSDEMASRSKTDASAATLRKPIGSEHTAIVAWVEGHFSAGWASEAQVALANRPVSLWIAVQNTELLGFACYDATALGFFGPIGVVAAARGKGLGAALLRACLQDMRAAGYGYAVAGGVGAPEFFRRVAGAIDIPDSTPGVYAGQLTRGA